MYIFDLITDYIFNTNFTKFTASSPYIQDDVTFCVSRSKPIPQWKNLFLITQDWQTYVIGFALYFATITCGYLLSTFDEKPMDLFHTVMIAVQILVGFASNYESKSTIMRLFFALYLIIPLWLTQIFCAYWIIFVPHVLYEIQIDSLSEIAAQDFRLVGINQFFTNDYHYLSVVSCF